MRSLEILKLKNLPGEGFEIFEAIALSSDEENIALDIPQPFLVQLPSSIQEQPGEELDQTLTSLWNAQNDVITEQNERLDMIYEDLEAKREKLENYTFDWGEIFLKSFLESGWNYILEKYISKWKDAIIPDWAEFLIDWAIDLVPRTIQFLIKKYRQAKSQVGAIKRENNGLLVLPKSWDNYKLRLDVLIHHEEAIENLLQEIVEHEQDLDKMTGNLNSLTTVLEKIETTLSGRAEEDEEEDLEEFWTVVEEKLTSILPVEEEENVEVENQQLPALPGKYPASVMTRFFHAILRMEAYKLQVLQKLSSNIELLQFNGQRLHLPNGDIVELTGIGTVTASPDQY